MASTAHIIRRRRQRKARQATQRTQRRLWITVFTVLIGGLIVLPTAAALGATAALYSQAVGTLPVPEQSFAAGADSGATQLVDRSARAVIYSLQDPLGDRRAWVTLETLPQYVIEATLIAEDPDFLRTTRFDLFGTVFNLWSHLLIAPAPADSSITGRLVRGVIAPGSDGSGIDGRTREIALVAELNRRYSPEDILEWHLNTNYYGSEAYGIDAAAQIYLGKRAVDLTVDEAALLASIPTAPQYNPFNSETAARGRQADVLRAMRDAGSITPQVYETAAAVLTTLEPGASHLPAVAPEFALYARDQAETILNSLGLDGERLVGRGSLRITTTLDLDLYYQTECALRAQIARLSGDRDPVFALDNAPCAVADLLPQVTGVLGDAAPNSGSLVVIDASTGEIRSMVGAATAADNQPGVTLHPFIYFEGFNGGLGGLVTPATMVLDIPRQFPASQEGLIYTVSNPDERFRGPMNLRQAMGATLMPPAADIAYRQGVSTVLRTAHQIGLNSMDEGAYDLMLLERGGEVSVLDVSYSYSVFASLGKMRGVAIEPVARGFRGRDPVAVLKIEDANGTVLWEYNRELAATCNTLDFCTPLLEPGLAYLVNDVLADQRTRWPVLGQGNVLDLNRTAAVVNGVTADRADSWTVGYTPQVVAGVHIGRSDESPMTLDTYGTQGAAAVWRAVMDYAHARDGLPAQRWERPDTVVDLQVCERSGLLPNSVCPAYVDIFYEGTEPRQIDSYWQAFEVNSQSGQLATATTPAEVRTTARYFVPPEEAADWWSANNQPLPPTDFDTVSRPELFRSVRITQPAAFAYVGGQIEIAGEMRADEIQFYQLAYGQGLNPVEWVEIGGQQTVYTPGEPLVTWNTTGLDGLYSLRLVVVMNDNSLESDVVQVTVDNVAPTVALVTNPPDKIYRWPGDDAIVLEAQVQDNLAVQRVEFFHNGQFQGADESWPYGFEWRVRGTGTETFSAVAFDAVGNQSNSQLTIEIVRAGS